MEENRENLGKTETVRFGQQNQKFVNLWKILHNHKLEKLHAHKAGLHW
jgi:hypothetical protein